MREEAVKNDLQLLPGKAVEAEIGAESGRMVQEIEIIDQNRTIQNVLSMHRLAKRGQTSKGKRGPGTATYRVGPTFW
jgi:hypothetical protein